MKRAVVIGKHVYLRPIERADIDGGWLDWVNDWSASRYRAGPISVNREQLERFYEDHGGDGTMFAICRKTDDRYIGNARLSAVDRVNQSAGYGRLIGREHRGQGLGTDSLVQILRYGFHKMNLHRLWTDVIAYNENSCGSNRKVGMHEDGVHRHAIFKDGAFHDMVHFSMLREEFDRLHGGAAEWRDYEAAEIEEHVDGLGESSP